MFAEPVHIPAAFAAGLLSFFSPCIIPLLPAYFSFITGHSLEDMTDNITAKVRTQVMISTAAYVLGFSAVFILLGASASYIGSLVYDYQGVIRVAGGLLIILMGLHLTGILRIARLDVERRIHIRKKPMHILGTFLVGMAFGAGWSPCIGPLLGSILILAGAQETVWQGVGLLGVYSLGLAVPFLILSVGINYLIVFLQRARRALRYVNMTAGVLLIAIGAILVSNKLYLFSIFQCNPMKV